MSSNVYNIDVNNTNINDMNKLKNKINEKEMKILEDNYLRVTYVDNVNNTVEIEGFTYGGVCMIIYIDLYSRKSLEEQLYDYVNSFNIDNDIEVHRMESDYRHMFSITESVKDFENWIVSIKKIIKELKESD